MDTSKSANKSANKHRNRPTTLSTNNRPKSGTQTRSSVKGKKTLESSTTRPCPEHSFLTDVADVRQMEEGLLQLLEDFHSGKLQAFAGQDSPFEKMDHVREQQEKLARLHFELDSMHQAQSPETQEARTAANTKLEKLLDNLQDLCISIQTLQKENPAGN